MTGDLVRAEEDLGRRVFSRKTAERAGRGRILPHVFMTKCARISVDRLNAAPPAEMEKRAREAAQNRSGPFRGWAVVTCDKARASGRQVVHTPQDDNPHHVDIRLPALAEDNLDEQRRHAQQLAAASSWRGSAHGQPRGTGL